MAAAKAKTLAGDLCYASEAGACERVRQGSVGSAESSEMSEILPADATRELVAQFKDTDGFEQAVEALLAAGFERTDLSMLGTHDSLEVAGELAGYRRDPAGSMRAGLAGGSGLIGSIALAGVLLLAAGPIGVAGAAVAAAAAGVLALRPFLGQLAESEHAEGFAQAIEDGHILLWVRTRNAEEVGRADAALTAAGGINLTRLAKPAREAPAE
jgi:hypothetical protein